MGASDSIQQGTSTFYEELNEASNILHNCSSRSLVIIDELGRGTSTHDGVAIAYATLHYLLKEKKCIVIFVTHYPKILDIQREFEGSVGAYHVSYLSTRKLLEITDEKMDLDTETEDLGEITFLYKLVAGASDRSFGLNVALLAQVSYMQVLCPVSFLSSGSHFFWCPSESFSCFPNHYVAGFVLGRAKISVGMVRMDSNMQGG
jgi:DNA mismatch repair protein MSH3